MTSGAIIALFFVVLLVLMLSGMPIAYSLGIASAGYMLMSGTSLAMMAQRMVNGANSFTMLAISFFFMAGELMNISGVTDKIINMAKALVGHFKGGLAQVNIVASVFFAGVSGSATADTAALGSTLIPKMVEEGYDLDFSAAITVASSCVGPIIPPSITLVLYGILAGEDVGKLLIAGIVPGVIIALFQMVYTHFYAVKMDYPSYPKATPREMGKAVTSGFSALMMPIIIIGGTLSGVFTPTESAAVAVLYGMIIGFFIYRNLKVPQFYESLKRVGVQSMNNMFILAAAACFSWVLTITKAADIMKEAGARSVRAIASHCVMSGLASERVQNSQLEEIVFTDSIPYSQRCAKVKQLSIADMFAETIRRVMSNESISSQYVI